jgi:hypothetical protein
MARSNASASAGNASAASAGIAPAVGFRHQGQQFGGLRRVARELERDCGLHRRALARPARVDRQGRLRALGEPQRVVAPSFHGRALGGACVHLRAAPVQDLPRHLDGALLEAEVDRGERGIFLRACAGPGVRAAGHGARDREGLFDERAPVRERGVRPDRGRARGVRGRALVRAPREPHRPGRNRGQDGS